MTLKKFKILPEYTVHRQTGPQHSPLFKVDVQIPLTKKYSADGKSKKGNAYPQRYCVILTIKDGLISEAHEFFDTALAETALFGAKIQKNKNISKADKDFDF